MFGSGEEVPAATNTGDAQRGATQAMSILQDAQGSHSPTPSSLVPSLHAATVQEPHSSSQRNENGAGQDPNKYFNFHMMCSSAWAAWLYWMSVAMIRKGEALVVNHQRQIYHGYSYG